MKINKDKVKVINEIVKDKALDIDHLKEILIISFSELFLIISLSLINDFVPKLIV